LSEMARPAYGALPTLRPVLSRCEYTTASRDPAAAAIRRGVWQNQTAAGCGCWQVQPALRPARPLVLLPWFCRACRWQLLLIHILIKSWWQCQAIIPLWQYHLVGHRHQPDAFF